MIKISDDQLGQGLRTLKKVESSSCNNLHHCLWGRLEDIPQKKCCEVPGFRRFFELDSPNLFGKAFELSEYQRVVGNLSLFDEESQTELHDLYIYSETFFLVFYPLYLANGGEIPFVRSDEIKEKEQKLSRKHFDCLIRKASKRMDLINCYWCGWVCLNYLSSLIYPEKYARAIILLINLFLTGAQGNEIRGLSSLSTEEKESFFEDIKKEISLRGQGGD